MPHLKTLLLINTWLLSRRVNMKLIFVIASNTFKEMVRDKVVYLILVLFFMSVASSYLFSKLVINVVYKVIIDFLLATFAFYGAALAIFLGVSLVYKEIDKKTVYLLFSKPISRVQFLLGKYFGLSFILMLFSLILGSFIYYMAGRVDSSIQVGILQSLYLGVVEFFVLMSITLLLSAVTNPLLGLFSGITLYFMGHLFSNIQGFLHKLKNPLLEDIINIMIHIFDLNTFNIRNEVVYAKTLTFADMAWRTTYGGILITIFLFATFALFAKREF